MKTCLRGWLQGAQPIRCLGSKFQIQVCPKRRNLNDRLFGIANLRRHWGISSLATTASMTTATTTTLTNTTAVTTSSIITTQTSVNCEPFQTEDMDNIRNCTEISQFHPSDNVPYYCHEFLETPTPLGSDVVLAKHKFPLLEHGDCWGYYQCVKFCEEKLHICEFDCPCTKTGHPTQFVAYKSQCIPQPTGSECVPSLQHQICTPELSFP